MLSSCMHRIDRDRMNQNCRIYINLHKVFPVSLTLRYWHLPSYIFHLKIESTKHKWIWLVKIYIAGQKRTFQMKVYTILFQMITIKKDSPALAGIVQGVVVQMAKDKFGKNSSSELHEFGELINLKMAYMLSETCPSGYCMWVSNKVR